MSDRVVGLDIGAASIKAAQVLRRNDGTHVVEKQAAVAVPMGVIHDGHVDPRERLKVAEALRDLWAKAKFATTDVIVGYNSSSAVFMTEILVPVMRPEDADQAMPTIIEQQEAIDATEHEVSWTVLGEVPTPSGPRLKVLVYTVRADFAESIADLASEAGLNLVGGDLSALASLRAMTVITRPARQLDAVVDVGASVTTLMLHHNGVPKMMLLDPDSAGNAATLRIAEDLALGEDDIAQAEWHKKNDEAQVGQVAQARGQYSENLAKKVAGGFHAYIARHAEEYDGLANLTLIGGGALLHGLGYYLHQALGSVPLTYAALDENIVGGDGTPASIQRDENGSGGDYLVAVGLGTGARL